MDESEDRTREFSNKSKGKKQLPLMFIGDIRVDGFDQPALTQALDAAGLLN